MKDDSGPEQEQLLLLAGAENAPAVHAAPLPTSSSRAQPSELRVLLCGLWIMSFAGIQYTFATYSSTVATKLGLNQSQLGVLQIGKDVGAYLSIFAGLCFDRFGPRATLLVGVRLASFWLRLLACQLPPLRV